MLDETPSSASRGAALCQSPRKRGRGLGTPVATPAITPQASPERRGQGDAHPQREYGWPRAKGTPAMISVSGSQYRADRGHQFTVGNVSNGLIYLRPVIRPAHELQQQQQQQQQQNYVLLPSTPPNSAAEAEERRRERTMAELSQNCDGTHQASPPRTPTTRNPAIERSKENIPYIKSSPPVPRSRHQRSRSYSTVDDHFGSAGGSVRTNLQVRIDQCDGPATEGTRPRTAGHQKSFQSLDVQIPHYNLGSPRFSPNGTPFLYGSSSLHLPSTTAELGSSHTSQMIDGRWLWPSADPRALSPSLINREINTSISSTIDPQGPFRMGSPPPMPQGLAPSPLAPSDTISSIPLISSPPIPSAPGPVHISPDIYDKLSFPPDSENPSIIRYDSNSQGIAAAIPARIIAQITSATFVDYHLLSDFFLTYRLFMNARDLAAHLIARLRWAIDRGDDTGMVVRVRTFVAIRHWLLNYFADDFVPSLLFRQEFVKTMNHLTHAVRANGNASDLKIIGELKKCWRRTCALYWDSSENTEAGVDEDITPGGPPGTRDETLSRPQSAMLRIPQLATPPPRLDIADHSSGTESFIRDVVQPRGIAMFEKNEGNLSKERNSAPLRSQLRSTVYSKSSASMQTETASDDNLERKKPSSSHGPSPTKKLRSGPHKRSGSFSDALRDNRYPLPLPNSIVKSTQLLMALPYAGSLVRGNLFPPTPAFVEVIAPSTPVNEPSSFSFGTQINPSSSSAILRPSEKHLTVPNKATGPGMKRLFGSFRKALGVRSTAYSSTSKHEKSAAGESVPVARTSSTRSNISSIEAMAANASKFGMRMSGDGKVARIDLLGAGAVDAFQRAMMEEITYTDQERHDDSAAMTSGDDISRDGGMQGMDTVDGACDGTDVAELGSTMQEVIDHRSEARQSIRVDSKTKEGFLDSPSTSNSSPAGDPESLFGGTSFLADESSPSDSSCDSLVAGSKVRTPSPTPAFEGRSVCVRRSKSFSFGRSSSRFSRTMVNTDGPSSSVACPTGMDVRSLHSARSFSFNRANSMLSQFGSVMDNISEFSEFGSFSRIIEDQATPRALLRRRPGGNLRAVATIGELEQPRPMSTGSINTGTLSLEDTRIPELQMRPRQRTISPDERSSQASGPHPIATRIVSLGAMGRGGGGLLSHPPPIPELPPDSLDPETPSGGGKVSFEAGVQMLRELPDDDGDDGGIEVALAKLEGTYQRKKSGEYTPVFDFRRSIATSESRDLGSSVVVVSEYHDELSGYDGIQDEDGEGTQEQQRRLKRRHKQVMDQVPLQTPPILDSNSSDRQDDKDEKEGLVGDHSEDSISILERGNSISVSQGGSFGGTIKSVPYPSKAGSAIASDPAMVGTATECDVDSSRLDSKLEMHLEHTNMQEQDDNTSEMSSDLSFEMIQQTAEERTATFPPIMPGTIISELGIPSHPLRHPPSPPLTLEQALSLPNSSLDDPPRTPRNPSISGKDGLSSQSRSTRTIRADTPRRSRESQIFQPTAIHLPFILAYDSELLAKQFTLIEKDALLEVDWKELVELNWSQADADVKDWVELLNSRDIKGVEVVVARFNLMCRWARSEIVMTKSADERARAIVKLIHIAAHARQMHNYATMYQITIALLTADIARLRKTWELVSSAEMGTFKELEALVQPVRNFHNLRTEMEKVTGESGCIPFVGLFTHDLILNAQRPPWIHFAQPDMPPLVNFERHRMTAAIVKRLLRLIEASHKYSFVAVDGVCERCLWISALNDDEIRGLSKGIE